MKRTQRRCSLLLSGTAVLALAVFAPLQPAAAEPVINCDQTDAGVAPREVGEPGCEATTPPDGAGTVGTAVHVVIHKSFTETPGPDQCVGTSTLAAIHRGASVILSEGSFSTQTRNVALGELFRSRMNDGMCEVLYIVSAPVLPVFNVQFVDPDGQRSPTFGPITSQLVTDQPGILQAVQIDMEFEPQP